MAILVDWAKQTVSGTPGTGTITLSTAVTGFIRLQDDTRLADGATVYYTIEDGSNFERGIGTYTATGTTLARTLIQAKFESGTYTENPGTGLTLTSAAIVSCSAVAATHNHRGALVYHSAAQSISNATQTTALFDSEVYDTDTFHSTATNTGRFTIPAGITKIELAANVEFNTNATSHRYAFFNKNGASIPGGGYMLAQGISGVPLRLSFNSAVITCATGDYFTLEIYQTSGGALNINPSAASAMHWFAIKVIE